jgi:hypothetical protein
MKKNPRRLSLHRETLRHLAPATLLDFDERQPHPVAGGAVQTQQLICFSPWCAPTVGQTCRC